MSHFDEALERLKRGLGVKHDQDVADYLGMTKHALSARKTRGGNFPRDYLLRAVHEHPDRPIDVDWVLTGRGGGVDRSAAVDAVRSRRGVYAPTLDMPYLLKILERVEELALERHLQLDAAALGHIAGAVYNVQQVGAPLNEALIHAMLELRAVADSGDG